MTVLMFYRWAMPLLLLSVALGVEAAPRKPIKKVNPEAQLLALSKRIDAETLSLSRSSHIDILAEAFHTPLSVIEEARSKGASWGKITIELAMSERLVEKDPSHYATTADALYDLNRLRADYPSWGALAKSLHLPLKPILLSVARSYQDQLSSGRTEHASL